MEPDTESEDTPDSAPPRGSRAWNLAKKWGMPVLVVGILAWLISSGRLQFKTFLTLRHGWIWALYGALLMVPQFFLVALRLRLLLGALELPGTYRQVFSWTMIGSFFDVAMPLSNGGDVVKAYYLSRHAGKGKRALALLSVLVDRVVGLLALFVFAWTVCLIAGRRIDDNPDLLRVSRVLLIVCTGSFAAFFVLVSPRLENSARRKRLMALLPFHHKFEALYVAFAGLRRHLWTLVAMLGLSLLVQVIGCASILCMAKGLNFTSVATAAPVDLELLPTLVVLPLALFLNTFGVAGGFGVGEAAFDSLFALLLGVREGAELALLFHCVALLMRMLGAPFVLMYRHKGHPPENVTADKVPGVVAEV